MFPCCSTTPQKAFESCKLSIKIRFFTASSIHKTMKKIRLLTILCNLLALPFLSDAQYDSLPIERLNVFGPIQFQNKSFNLTRTSFNADSATYNTYKQVYLAAGESKDTFRNMMIINVFTGPNMSLEDIANAKLDELRELQKNNPIINKKEVFITYSFLF